MKFKFLALLIGAGFVSSGNAAFVLDSLNGDITTNEIGHFISTVQTYTPEVNNYGNKMSFKYSGTRSEACHLMYESTHDVHFIDQDIRFCDVFLAHRNDKPAGDNRVMWEGTVAPVWPEEDPATSTIPGYSGCENGMVAGHLLACALDIFQNQAIWNTTVAGGDPNGYGATYKARAQTYLNEVDYYLNNYSTIWFVNSSTHRIQRPTDPRWSANTGNAVCTPWNRQWMFVMAYLYSAKCHDVLGDNPSYLPLYKDVVKQFANWFVAPQSSGGADYYTTNSHNVAKWYYDVPPDRHIEGGGHAELDLWGLFDAYESQYSDVTSAQMKVYADTGLYVINRGSDTNWSTSVDGSGVPYGTTWGPGLIYYAQWDSGLYQLVAQSYIDANLLNDAWGSKTVGHILYMKHWFYVQSQDFTISATPSSRTTTPGGSVTYTVTLSAINGFNSNVGLSISGLPSGATASFSPASVNGSGSSTLTVTTSASTPAGSSALTITGAGGSKTHSVSVSLVVSDFNLSVTPSSQTVTAGNGTTYTVNLGSINGFSSAVSLSAGGLPSGAPATFSPSSVTPVGASTMTVTTSTSTPAGTYTVTITGTSGSLQHSATATLVVNGATLNWTTVNDTSSGITYNAGWSYSTNRNLGDYNNDAHYNKTNGNYAQFTFTGTAVRYITETYSDEGNVDVYIDGVLQTTVDCNTSTRQVQFIAYANAGLSAGSHTIKVVKSSGSFMLLDAFAYVPASTTSSPPVQVNLSSAFNRSNGLVTDGATFTGGFDGGGAACSANLLGTSLTSGGTTFNLGPANAADTVSGAGQTITLPAGNYSTLQFIGAGVNGNQASQAFVVNYSDGTSTTFTQSISDWFTPQSYAGETIVSVMAYRDLSGGTADNRTFDLYGYSFALNSGKTISSLKLPTNSNVELLAITLR